jgi:hypothetical protein
VNGNLKMKEEDERSRKKMIKEEGYGFCENVKMKESTYYPNRLQN